MHLLPGIGPIKNELQDELFIKRGYLFEYLYVFGIFFLNDLTIFIQEVQKGFVNINLLKYLLRDNKIINKRIVKNKR